VPPLILQPLVENAVRHGIATRLDGGAIEIAVRRAGDRAIIVVSNPRDPDASRKGTGLGLDIVRRRLAAAFGDAAALSIEAAPESYKVSVSLPVEEPTS
jgi:LytS/YehU family sensor histidine kinase